ncbi:Mitochondrial phosphate carrier protein [Fusarium oxysporum f. sp. cubense]|uniref:Mitochondrial phosphate carrier protein n=1 Tax=Fusarium oxysporum f. sp. cubense TaxID=61366 RepID=A0A559LWH4_FUSOC|nr:Mitochondrial phosphate carrier protein [Fusarium oxysporum f. sp. cubense]
MGLGPTITGYCLQGAFKFGGYEYFKARAVDYLGQSAAASHRNAVYLGSAAAAEFLGDIALCPFESVRIRLVSQPSYATDSISALAKLAREEGISGLYSGLSPILLKQIPYTMATFLVYEKAIQTAYSVVDKKELSSMGVTGINLGAGLVAGLAAAVVSQPADTMLSRINKEKAGRDESTTRRLFRIASELGLRGAYTGMQARAVMVSGMTAVQFGIYGDIKKLFGAIDGVELSQRYVAENYSKQPITIFTWDSIFNLALAQRRKNFICTNLTAGTPLQLERTKGPKRAGFGSELGGPDEKYCCTLDPEIPFNFTYRLMRAYAIEGERSFTPGHTYSLQVRNNESIRLWRYGRKDNVLAPPDQVESLEGREKPSRPPIKLCPVEAIEFEVTD